MTTFQEVVAVEATVAEAAWGRVFGAAMDVIAVLVADETGDAKFGHDRATKEITRAPPVDPVWSGIGRQPAGVVTEDDADRTVSPSFR